MYAWVGACVWRGPRAGDPLGLLPLNVSVSRTNASFVLRTRIFSDSAPYTVVKCALGRASARSTRLATRTREIIGL